MEFSPPGVQAQINLLTLLHATIWNKLQVISFSNL